MEDILFNRTPNQFLDCKNPDKKKGLVLSRKVRAPAKKNLDKVLDSRQAT